MRTFFYLRQVYFSGSKFFYFNDIKTIFYPKRTIKLYIYFFKYINLLQIKGRKIILV